MIKVIDVAKIGGICWQMTGQDAPDRRPTVSAVKDPHQPNSWDWYDPTDFSSVWLKKHGHQPVVLIEHFSVSEKPKALTLQRRDLLPGDCFRYVNHDSLSQQFIVEGKDVSLAGMPGTWDHSYNKHADMDAIVVRIAHWNVVEEGSREILRTSACGAYVLVNATEVPMGVWRSQRNTTLEEAIRDEVSDIKWAKQHHLSGPSDAGLCWMEKPLEQANVSDLIEIPATKLRDGDCIVALKDSGDWQETGYKDEPIYVREWGSDGKALRVGVNFGATMNGDKPWMVRVKRTGTRITSVVLPCVDPLKELRDAVFVREIATVEDIKGLECLTRFEKAQQTESVVHLVGGGYVSTNAECGLTTNQVEAAQDLWSYKLRLMAAEAKLRDTQKLRVNLCDDPDEMPNMVYVED